MATLICGIEKRNDANELIYKIERDSQTQRMNLRLPQGWGRRLEGRDSWEVWDGHVHTAMFKKNKQKDLLYSNGTLLNVTQQQPG